MSTNFKRGGSSDEQKFRLKKRAQTHELSSSSKVKLQKGGGSKNVKPTYVTYGIRHYSECLSGTRSYFGCGKVGHNVRGYPTIASRRKEGTQVAPNNPKEDIPKVKARLLRSRG